MIQFVQLLVTWTGENFGKKKKDHVSKEPDLIRGQKYLLHYFKRQVLCFSEASCFKNSFPQLFQNLSVLLNENDFEDVISFPWSRVQIISHSVSKMMLRTGILSPWVLVQPQPEPGPCTLGETASTVGAGLSLPEETQASNHWGSKSGILQNQTLPVTDSRRVLLFILLSVIMAGSCGGRCHIS